MLIERPLQTGHVADWVDSVLAAQKRFVGPISKWVPGNRSEERRVHEWPVVVDGRLIGAFVSLTSYPFERTLRFTITLNVWPAGWKKATCIWRVDHEPEFKSHTNTGKGVSLTGERFLKGPNYHAWEMNRHLCKPAHFPELEVAQSLPGELREFDQTLRWFCGRVGIILPSEHMPECKRRSNNPSLKRPDNLVAPE